MLQGILETLRPAVVAMIATAGVSILISAFFGESTIYTISSMHIDMVVIFIIAIVLLQWKKCNPIYIMVLCGVLKLIKYLILGI